MPRKKTGAVDGYQTADGARYRIRYRDREGKRHSRSGFPDEDTARFALRLISKGKLEQALELSESEARDRSGADKADATIAQWDPKTVTLAEFVEKWLATATDLSPTTAAGYRRQITTHVVPALGKYLLAQITPAMLTELYGRLLADGRVKTKSNGRYQHGSKASDHSDGLGANSVRKIHFALSSMFNAAILYEAIETNPCASPLAKPPTPAQVRHATERIEPWTEQEAQVFLTELAEVDPVICAAIQLSVTTGLRRGELLGLQVKSVDLVGGRIHVVNNRVAYVDQGTKHVIEKSPKGGRRRVVSIGPDTVNLLKQYMLGIQIDTGRDLEPDDHLFLNSWGNVWEPNSFSRRWRESLAKVQERLRRREINLPAKRLHDLRHFHATYLIRHDVHARIVQERLGHSSITTTMSIYAHLLDSDQDAAGALSDGILSTQSPARPAQTPSDTHTPRESTPPDLGEPTTDHPHIPTNGEAK